MAKKKKNAKPNANVSNKCPAHPGNKISKKRGCVACQKQKEIDDKNREERELILCDEHQQRLAQYNDQKEDVRAIDIQIKNIERKILNDRAGDSNDARQEKLHECYLKKWVLSNPYAINHIILYYLPDL